MLTLGTERLDVVFPDVARILHQEGKALWHRYQRAAVRAAGFHEQDLVAGIRAEPIGQHASRGSGTHDDVVELAHVQDPPELPYSLDENSVLREYA